MSCSPVLFVGDMGKFHLPPTCSDQRQEQEKATASGRVCLRHPRLQLLIRLLHRNPAYRLRDAPISLSTGGRPSSG
ncbi:ANK_REP_REGION domain-containing protein [Trichonephila clavipes]|nr:ANK_REP_REGION domain-containing protein [Trichonephila clavipes]